MFASLTDVKVLHILNLWPGLTPPPRTLVPHDSAAPFAKHPENHTSNFKHDSHNLSANTQLVMLLYSSTTLSMTKK